MAVSIDIPVESEDDTVGCSALRTLNRAPQAEAPVPTASPATFVYIEQPRESLKLDGGSDAGQRLAIRVTTRDTDLGETTITLDDRASGSQFMHFRFTDSALIEAVAEGEAPRVIGCTLVSLDELQEFQLCCASNLVIRSLVNDRYRKIGTVAFRFVIVTPLPVSMRDAFQPRDKSGSGSTLSRHTSPRGVTIIGHRGIGSDEMGSRIRENTLLAFKQAAKYGADAIEFDVFLTADRTPVVFHDLEINHSTSQQKIPITSLCEEGLRSLDKDNQDRILTLRERCESTGDGLLGSIVSSPQAASASKGALESGKRIRSLHDMASTFPSRGRVESEVSPFEAEGVRDSVAVQEKLPSLRAVLEGTPEALGALIEIKYPTVAAVRKFPSRSCHDRDTVADVILRAIYDYGSPGTRRYMFSSFDPEMCLTLRQKQVRFPVIFNTWFGYEDTHDNTEVDFTDLRNRDPMAAAEFCLRNGIEGLCLEAAWLNANFNFAEYCRLAGLTLYTYGPENNRVSHVEMQTRHLGVSACIVDNIGRFRGGADGEGKEMSLAEARKLWSSGQSAASSSGFSTASSDVN